MFPSNFCVIGWTVDVHAGWLVGRYGKDEDGPSAVVQRHSNPIHRAFAVTSPN